jgi:hypothetical protein
MSPYTAFLRIRHPSIDPAELTAALGLEPAHAWAAGSAREATGGGPARGAHPDTYWLAPLGDPGWERSTLATGPRTHFFWPPRQALPLETFLLAQLRLLLPKRELLLRLAAEGGSVEVALTLAAGSGLGLELAAPLLRSFAELGVGLSIEISAGTEGEA